MIKDLIKKNRSYRRFFAEKAVDTETLVSIVDEARFCPSACNSQPWKMYCCVDEQVKKKVLNAISDKNRNAFLKNAKAFIVVAEKARRLKKDVEKKFSLDHFVKYDVGELVAYITLTAKSKGVESIIIGWVDKEKIKQAVELGENESCSLVVALGYSDSPLREKIRREKEEVIEFK